MDTFAGLGIALFAGLLIGVERGWKQSAMPEETRVMGLRTFALIGLGGGVCGLLGQVVGPLVLGLSILGLAILLAVTYWRAASEHGDVGCTTEVAALVTFMLGAVAVSGHGAVAAAAAVVMAFLLEMKSRLHALLPRLTTDEIRGALTLLLISVAVLPLLPNQGYGPWESLNPYLIWWMVVLIAAIQFSGYVAVRVVGTRYGIMLTGMVAGLMASTPLALSFARLGRNDPANASTLSSGILAASTMMFPRALIVATAIAPPLLGELLVPLLGMMIVGLVAAAWFWWSGPSVDDPGVPVRNPFELGPAIRFGLLLALIMVAVAGARAWLGDSGIYAIALVSGLTDVDPVTLSLANLAGEDASYRIAANGIIIAAMANTFFKGMLVVIAGGRRMGFRVMPAMLLVILVGGLSFIASPLVRLEWLSAMLT